jgi:hypothetical protein
MRRLAWLPLVAVTLVCAALVGCGHKLTPEEQQQLTDLKQQLQTVRQEVEAAKMQQGDYAGGLLKALLDVRLEVLKINEALLDQRVQALESGAKITVVVQATKDDPIRAAQLAAEIEAQKVKLAQAKAESDRYSGGLVQAISLVSVATVGNTVAMLEQQHLMAKYGLALPTPPTSGETTPK